MAKKSVSILKRIRQNKKRALRNKAAKSKIKTYFKKVINLLNSGNLDEAKRYANLYYSAVDKALKKNIIHKNTASRKKSLLAKHLNKAIQSKQNT